MKKILPFLLASLFLASCVTSKRVLQLDGAVVQRTDSLDISYYENKYGKYDAVYFTIERFIDHYGQKSMGAYSFGSWEFSYIIRRRYLVLNPDEQKLTTILINVPRNGSLEKVSMTVSKPDGSVSRYQMGDMVRETDSKGYYRYKYAYPNITKGCIIDEAFEISYNALQTHASLDYDIDVQFPYPCEKFVFKYAYPDWWTIKIKQTAENRFPQFEELIDKDNRKKIISYTVKNIPAYKNESYSPSYKEIADYLEFMVTEMNMVSWYYKGSTNWKDLVSTFKRYIINRDGFFSTKVSRTTEKVIEGLTDPRSIIDSVISYIQNNIEIATDYEDRNFADILTDKKGNAYAITGLAHSMLQKAGFKPQYVLVHSAEEGYCDDQYYNISQFTLPAVVVKVDTMEYILTPYRKDMQVDIIPEIMQGQPALVIEPDGSVKTRILPDGGNYVTEHEDSYDVSVTEDGSLLVKETTTLKGTAAYIFRNALRQLNEAEQDKYIKKRLSAEGLDVSAVTYTLINEKEYKKPFIIEMKYTVDNITTIAGNEILFQPAGLFSPTAIKDSPLESEERQNPIRIYFAEQFTKKITLRYPAQWKLVTELKPTSISTVFGTLVTEYSVEPGLITSSFKRNLLRTSQPKEKIAELVSLIGKQSSVTLPTIIFKTPIP